MSKTVKTLLGLFAFLSVLFFWLWPHLPIQDALTYFDFADKRSFDLIPNALDVLSNLGFLTVGCIGVYRTVRNWNQPSNKLKSFILCISIGAIATCFGSMYFHWSPTPQTLVWDRLTMTLGFVAMAAMAIADRVDEKLGFYFLIVLFPIGVLTVVGYSQAWLSLRPYIVLQFGTLIFVASMILFIKGRHINDRVWWSCIGLYAIAKVFELADHNVFEYSGIVSGHTLKHLYAALSIYKIVGTVSESPRLSDQVRN